jgi:hypothetical protein
MGTVPPILQSFQENMLHKARLKNVTKRFFTLYLKAKDKNFKNYNYI